MSLSFKCHESIAWSAVDVVPVSLAVDTALILDEIEDLFELASSYLNSQNSKATATSNIQTK